jgi:serine protease AprX
MSRIRVRLVPKTRGGESITMDMGEITPQLAKRFAPDPDRASEALRPALSMGIASKITRHGSLEGDVPKEIFENAFQTTLVEMAMPTSERATFGRTGTVFTTKEEIQVPDELKNTIAFAYIPTPPLFFGISAVPPNVGVYHLRLMDVLRMLNGGQCHRRGWTGRGIRVAMTDTGFANHPYFVTQGYTINRVSTPTTQHPLVDTSGHGTGESANALVMAPDCRFIGVKHDDYSAEALETALEQNPQIITNSWGWNIDDLSKEALKVQNPNLFNELRDLENIISDAIDDGVIMVFAGGNGHRAFPACMPNVLAIGGVTVEQGGQLKASSYASSFTSKLFPGRQVPDVCGIVGEYSPSTPMKGHIMLPVPNGSELEGDNMPVSQSKKGWGIFSGTSAAARK